MLTETSFHQYCCDDKEQPQDQDQRVDVLVFVLNQHENQDVKTASRLFRGKTLSQRLNVIANGEK